MKHASWIGVFASSLGFLFMPLREVRPDEVPEEYRKAITKGLDWIAKSQYRDGHWDVSGGRYGVSMTAMAGMALLMEGSTIRDGKYSLHIRRAVDWLIARTQRNGLIGNPNYLMDRERYMYGHGFGMLFLACVYGEEDDGDLRRKLEEVLTRAVQYTAQGQTSRGGWGYLARGCNQEGDDLDEGSVTITQVQALRAARNAGIAVSASIIDRARGYLKESTGPRGGVIYSLSMGRRDERPSLAAAAVCCGFSAGEYGSPLVKGWLKACKETIPPILESGNRMGHDEYTHYYFAQVLYVLGDDGYAKLYPESKPENRLLWSKYRKTTFDSLIKAQNADGSWTGTGRWGSVGPVYSTATALTILQLDIGTLPIYQR
jgi:hypothetical protein